MFLGCVHNNTKRKSLKIYEDLFNPQIARACEPSQPEKVEFKIAFLWDCFANMLFVHFLELTLELDCPSEHEASLQNRLQWIVIIPRVPQPYGSLYHIPPSKT